MQRQWAHRIAAIHSPTQVDHTHVHSCTCIPYSNNIQVHLQGNIKQVTRLQHRCPELHPKVDDSIWVIRSNAHQQLSRGVRAGHLVQLSLIVKRCFQDTLAGCKPKDMTRGDRREGLHMHAVHNGDRTEMCSVAQAPLAAVFGMNGGWVVTIDARLKKSSKPLHVPPPHPHPHSSQITIHPRLASSPKFPTAYSCTTVAQ